MTTPAQAISLAVETRIDQLCDRFESTWNSASSPTIELLLDAFDSEPDRAALLRRLMEVDLELFARGDTLPNEADYQHRFPEHAELIADVFRQLHASQVENAAVRGEASTIELSPADTSYVQAEPAANHLIPTHIGRFEVVEVLGRGGFGTVYRARDPKVGRDIAIKVPNSHRLASLVDASRFLREARAAATLRHANICAVHDIGEEDGRSFIVMDYIAGEPLSTLIERGDELPVERIVQWVRELALALQVVHQQDIIHRDLKPSNVMIDTSGTPIIMDFGLARLSQTDDEAITHGGDILGTPSYMPPEQARGDVQAIDARSDVYSLGAILYELLCGQRPYRGRASDIIGQIQHAAPPRPSAHDPGVDRELEAVCLKAIARKPSQRYQSMAEFAQALSAVSLTTKNDRRAVYRRASWAAVALLIVAVAAAITYVQTDNGWLRIEADEDVQLVVTQGGREVTIIDTKTQSHVRLHSGEYVIELRGDRNDVTLSRSRFSMTRGDREIVSVQRVPSPAARVDSELQTAGTHEDSQLPNPPAAASSIISRQPAYLGQGDMRGHWRLDGGELVQEKVGMATMEFGDRSWSDYDVHVQTMTLGEVPGTQGGTLQFRVMSPNDYYALEIGNYGGEGTDLVMSKQGNWARVGPYLRIQHTPGRWYDLKVEVRGSRIRCFVDGQQIFDCIDASFSTGMIGLHTWSSRVKWKNLTVTDPEGNLLWEGFPDLRPLESSRTITEVRRRYAEPLDADWHGDWRLVGDELVQEKVGKAFMQFGDSRWTDYDVRVEMLALPGSPDTQGGGIDFRATSVDDHYSLAIGTFGGEAMDLTKTVNGGWARVGHYHRVPLILEHWYTLRVETRGTNLRCFADGIAIFNCNDDSLARGMIALTTWNSRVKWRSLTVTDPNGNLLWEGFPDVSPQQTSPATDDQPASSSTDNPTATPTDN